MSKTKQKWWGGASSTNIVGKILPNWQRRERTCNGESWGFRGEAGLGRIVGMEAVCLRVLLFFGFVAALPATAGAFGLCCATFRVKYNCRNTIIRFAQSVSAYTSSYSSRHSRVVIFMNYFRIRIKLSWTFLSKEGYESLQTLYIYDLWVLLH